MNVDQVGMLSTGLAHILTIPCLLTIVGGVVLGIIFGALPGLSATMAIALCLPISFGMPPVQGIALLVALYVGGVSGGLITAILLKIPGTPASVATVFDGGPMAEKGEAGKALGVGIFYSFVGTLISIVALVTISPLLSKWALRIGYFEYCAIALFSLSLVSSLVEGSVFKGIAAAAIGVLFTLVGAAPIDGLPRLTFGLHDLDAGFNILPALIGLFAVKEIFSEAENTNKSDSGVLSSYKMKGFGFSVKEFFGQFWNMTRSAAIGVGIGILPGIGAGTSNLVAYAAAKNQSKQPEKYGTGIIDGVVASETANNASIGGALIPLLSLGIPGDLATAMLLGGLTLHSFSPGPLLFVEHGDVVYSIFAALFFANIAMLIAMYGGLRMFVKLLKVPKYLLLPCVIALCVVGAYGVNNMTFDVITLFFFGILGYVFAKLNVPATPFILGFILGPMIETNLRRGMMITQGDASPLLTTPVSLAFIVSGFASIVWAIVKNKRKARK